MTPLKIMTVLGTRPEIIRLSAIIPKLDRVAEHLLVYTGQNSSDNLSTVFFNELQVRQPDVNLGVDTTSLGSQLASLFSGIETVLDQHRPDRVLILGDTNSALVAYNCKRRGIPVYHMEAGNRCFDERVPEEVNRRVIDHCSSVLLPYTARSAENLVREGIPRQRIFITGNPIYEVLQRWHEGIESSDALTKHNVREKQYLLVTTHRAENVDRPQVFQSILDACAEVAALYAMPMILSVHPRIRSRIDSESLKNRGIFAVDAMPFFEFIKLERFAALLLTDSGTVQEEAAIFGTPVLTIRDTTERPETVEAGTNLVTSTRKSSIVAAARYLHGVSGTMPPAPPEYVDPHVSDKVIRIILSNPRWTSGTTTYTLDESGEGS